MKAMFLGLCAVQRKHVAKALSHQKKYHNCQLLLTNCHHWSYHNPPTHTHTHTPVRSNLHPLVCVNEWGRMTCGDVWIWFSKIRELSVSAAGLCLQPLLSTQAEPGGAAGTAGKSSHRPCVWKADCLCVGYKHKKPKPLHYFSRGKKKRTESNL